MKIKVYYNKDQLEATVNFVATNNSSFLGKHDRVRESLLNHIQELVQRYPDVAWLGTMGYYVWAIMDEQEGIDSDENLMNIEFMVAPDLSNHHNSDSWEYTYYNKLLP